MHPIHVLWATPRSTSTAFEWMMRMRGDMTCFHEPFGVAWYQGEDARAPARPENGPKQPGLTFASVMAELTDAAEKQPVFSKDMPQYTDHMWDAAFLDGFNHSFLIRDPAKVLASLKRSYEKSGHPGFTATEIGFAEQRRLFDLLAEHNGAPPPVIDSDDLLEDPHSMVAAWCEAIGIPFIPDALSWEPGNRSEVIWYSSDENVWHGALSKSDGLKPQPRKHVEVTDLPAGMQKLYAGFLPHYQHLHAQRLQVG